MWWAKYFGLYACENRKGLAYDMHFVHNDIVFGKPELCNEKSCTLDVLDIKNIDRMKHHLMMVIAQYNNQY